MSNFIIAVRFPDNALDHIEGPDTIENVTKRIITCMKISGYEEVGSDVVKRIQDGDVVADKNGFKYQLATTQEIPTTIDSILYELDKTIKALNEATNTFKDNEAINHNKEFIRKLQFLTNLIYKEHGLKPLVN